MRNELQTLKEKVLKGNRIAELRLEKLDKEPRDKKEKQWTQEALAKRIGVKSPKTYIDYESKKSVMRWQKGDDKYPSNEVMALMNITLDKLLSLSLEHGKSIDYLLGLDNESHDGNTYIEEQIGLSDKAIEYLRLIKQNPGGLSERTTKFINYVLEKAYDDYQEKCATATNEEFAHLQFRELNRMNSKGESLHDPQTWMKAASLSVKKALALNMHTVFDYLYDYVLAPPKAWYADDYDEKHLFRRIESTVFYHDEFGLRALGSGKAEPLRRDMNLLKLWRNYQIDAVKERLDEMVKKEEQDGKHN